MSLLLFFAFIVLPIAEIAVFIEASRLISVPAVIVLTLATAFAGSFLMRTQGFAALTRFMQAVEKGEPPILPVLDGMGILAAGILLLTPGLLTDAVGLLLFVPPIRRALGKWLFRRMLAGGRVQFHFNDGGKRPHPSGAPRPGRRPQDNRPRKSDNVVDVEFETIAPKNKGQNSTTAKPGDAEPKDGKTSPWRKD